VVELEVLGGAVEGALANRCSAYWIGTQDWHCVSLVEGVNVCGLRVSQTTLLCRGWHRASRVLLQLPTTRQGKGSPSHLTFVLEYVLQAVGLVRR